MQKTAYELRIRDWSSGVCASVLKISAGSVGVPPVTVRSAPWPSTTIELLMNGASAGRDPSGSTSPRNVSEKNHPVAPPCSGSEKVLSAPVQPRSEEHTSELQSLMRISYAVFCLKKTT